MEWNIDNIEEIVNYINQELSSRAMVNIEREEFGVNERVIHKRLVRLGYKKIDNQYRLQEEITSNITPSKTRYKPIQEVKEVSNNSIPKEESTKNIEPIQAIQGEINIDKLNLLLDNIDLLLKLIPKSNITSNTSSLRTGVNDVKSFRVDTGLYKAIKERATREKINIADILNKALEDYLNNYL